MTPDLAQQRRGVRGIIPQGRSSRARPAVFSFHPRLHPPGRAAVHPYRGGRPAGSPLPRAPCSPLPAVFLPCFSVCIRGFLSASIRGGIPRARSTLRSYRPAGWLSHTGTQRTQRTKSLFSTPIRVTPWFFRSIRGYPRASAVSFPGRPAGSPLPALPAERSPQGVGQDRSRASAWRHRRWPPAASQACSAGLSSRPDWASR